MLSVQAQMMKAQLEASSKFNAELASMSASLVQLTAAEAAASRLQTRLILSQPVWSLLS